MQQLCKQQQQIQKWLKTNNTQNTKTITKITKTWRRITKTRTEYKFKKIKEKTQQQQAVKLRVMAFATVTKGIKHTPSLRHRKNVTFTKVENFVATHKMLTYTYLCIYISMCGVC